jgi:hypothetical protein
MRFRLLLPSALFLAAASCSHPKQAVFIDPALATLTPPDTTVLVGARLDKLRQSPTYQRHFADTHFPVLDRFAEETGLDPKRDLWEILYASNGSNSVLMTRGRFSPTDIEPRIQREGATRTAYRGYTLIGDENSSIFFMNQTTALAGSTPALMRIINRQNGGLSYGIPGSLMALVRTLPPDSQFWAVFIGNTARLPVPDSSNLGNLNSLLRTVASGTLAADLRQGLNARAVVTCVSDADAKQTSDSLQGLLTIGRAASSKKPDVVRAFDTIHVSQNQRNVELSADVPQDLVDRVVNTFGK